MKVFILAMIFFLPNGEMKMNMVEVPQCPSEESVKLSIKSMIEQGQVTKALGWCEAVDLGVRA